MSESFKQYKAKFLRNAIIVSIVSGVCGALIACGVLLLAFKLGGVEFFWALYIPIALGVFALCGGVAFVIVRPTDVKVAKKLDKEYALNERIQTMVEFSEEQGDLVELQRRDADEKLCAVTPKKIKISAIVSYVVAGLVACAMFFTAVFVPAKADDTLPPDEPTFIITDWQRTAIQSLIADVQSSDLAYENKTTCVVYLEALLELLDEELPASEMKGNVSVTMDLVVAIADEANSYDDIAEQFVGEEFEDFAGTLTDGAKSYGAGRDLKSYQRVLDKRTVIDESVNTLFNGYVEGVNTTFGEYTAGEFISAVSAFANNMKSNLSAVTGWDGFDDLYKAITKYADELINICKADGLTTSTRREQVNQAGATFAKDGAEALSTQAYTEMMCEYVRRSLANIFGITIIDPAPEVPPDNEGGNTGNPDGGGGHGGISGGSDDEIFDTGSGEYVKYKDVLPNFTPAVDAILERDDIPEELKNRIREYFRNLQSENNQENASAN